jgi:transposase/transposase-like protein
MREDENEVITLNQKQEIILQYFSDGLSHRQIAKQTGFHRNTVKKYIAGYQEVRQKLVNESGINRIDKIDLIADLVEAPMYHVANRQKRSLTIEITTKIQEYLAENKRKKELGQSKQCKKIIDIHEALLLEGFEIGYTTVRNTVAKLIQTAQEAYIKILYNPGQICEFDWGEVKIFINGTLHKLQIAVFTSAFGNYRFAILFANQKSECFVESHAHFFAHLSGAYQTMVYDNMKVAVKKFVGRKEKEPTDALLKLSTYYGFSFRFCNIHSGNEKGHVEKSVEYIRRKAFCGNDHFADLAEANAHLLAICHKLNQKIQVRSNQTAMEGLEQEKPYLLTAMPIYESARIEWLRVDKYSTIQIDQCHYSVPDYFVGQMIFTKVYASQIRCFHNNTVVSEHQRLLGCQEWSIQIQHYCRTFQHKPGALAHSYALKQADPRLQTLYQKHFQCREKDFIEVLFLYQKHGLKAVETAILGVLVATPTNLTSDKIRLLCERSATLPPMQEDDDLSSIIAKSKEQLASYSTLLPASSEGFSRTEVSA